MASLYPVYLKLEGEKCIVIGGGKVAQRKVEAMLKCGADITVISPDLTPTLQEMFVRGKINHLRKSFSQGDLENAKIVIGATDDEIINREVARECFERNLLVNIVDDPEKCNFFVPSVVNRGDLNIAISTGGNSPAAAKKIRQELEQQFGDEYARYLTILGQIRREAMIREPDPEKRQVIFHSLVESDLLDLVRRGHEEGIKERIAQCISWK